MTPNPAGLCMFVCFCVFLCERKRERERNHLYYMQRQNVNNRRYRKESYTLQCGENKNNTFKKKKKRKNLSYLCFWQILYQLCLDLELKSHFSFCKPPVLPPKLISRFNCKYYFHSFKKIKDFY